MTVVDACSFLDLYASTDTVTTRADLGAEIEDDEASMGEADGDLWGSVATGGQAGALGDGADGADGAGGGAPSVVQLLVEQVETADVIVLNKIDGVDAAGLAYLQQTLGVINGFAEVATGDALSTQLLTTPRAHCHMFEPRA